MDKLSRRQSPEYDRAVQDVRHLLVSWLTSGVDLFLRLRGIELDGVWKHGGHLSFVAFLRDEFPGAIGFDRYKSVIRAVELHGEEKVRAVGVHSCHLLVKPKRVHEPRRKEKPFEPVERVDGRDLVKLQATVHQLRDRLDDKDREIAVLLGAPKKWKPKSSTQLFLGRVLHLKSELSQAKASALSLQEVSARHQSAFGRVVRMCENALSAIQEIQEIEKE